MNKSESTKEITKAIISVMDAVKGIEKSITVGSGANSYKGVPDQEVKKIIGEQMVKNGLAIVPTGINKVTKIDRWEETNQYGTKQKQSVFTEATTSYILLHTSGEWIEISGYGHGTDTQDKGAGKATTYALKYTLLYLFMVPTGKIDDSDNSHSDSQPIPKNKTTKNEIDELEIQQWLDKINGCGSVDELLKVFTEGKSIINSTPELFAAKEAKKKSFSHA